MGYGGSSFAPPIQPHRPDRETVQPGTMEVDPRKSWKVTVVQPSRSNLRASHSPAPTPARDAIQLQPVGKTERSTSVSPTIRSREKGGRDQLGRGKTAIDIDKGGTS